MNRLRNMMWLLCMLPGVALAQSKSFDSKQPIEITSDQLEVHQAENVAIFTGNVVAIQNDVRLKSDKMTVYYTSAEEKKSDSGQAATQADAAKQTIKKIDVDGNVFLATPEETASGARGNYDVEGEEIHLYENVVLTRGANTLKGSELTYNFASGKSIITGGAVAEDAAGKGTGRVRALFVPDKKQ
ncbi:MAG: lipopolysaccharide transport periplasmic protein LptA [Alphaproteobacteria bacterium]|nr:lipopolysaccharide transport periplasmic protein LptA [Alphaproteobacteria bacterium]